MRESDIKYCKRSKITKTDIQNININLLAIVGIMQASEIFSSASWLIDLIKYTIFILSVMVIFLQILERKNSAKSVIFITLISISIAYTCIQTGNFSFLLICLFLITGNNTTIENFIRRNLNILVVFGGTHIVLWIINYFVPIGLTVYTNISEHRIAFGFTHPNICSIKFGWGILMYLWLNWCRMTRKKWIALFSLCIIFYATTKSDSWMIEFGILLLAFFKSIKIITVIVSMFAYIAFPILGMFNILSSKMYLINNSVAKVSILIDKFFNRRISAGYLAIKENGMTLLGQSIEMNHEWDSIFNYNGYTIDSTYIYLYVCIGMVYYIAISVGFYMLRKYCDYRVALIILAFSLFALIEVHSIYLTNSFALLLLKTVIFKEKEIK